MADEVKEVANKVDKAQPAKRQYAKGERANRALKTSLNRSRKAVNVPVTSGRKATKALEVPTDAELADGGYVPPTGTDHSYGALDTHPPDAERMSKARGGDISTDKPKKGRKKGARR
jgi:hypothetical protein